MCIRDRIYTHFYAGDYFGERGVLQSDSLRGASVVAVTDLQLLSIDRHDFKYIFGDELSGTGQFIKNLLNINEVRNSDFTSILMKNKLFSNMPSSQKIHFQAILQEEQVKQGEHLWSVGEKAEYAYFVVNGSLILQALETKNGQASDTQKNQQQVELHEGTIVCDLSQIVQDKLYRCNLYAKSDSVLYKINKEDLVQFVNKYPGFRLLCSGTYYLE
eukprot:TRINITY_DN1549_c0_g1_i5.p1 TRINITY_DN1549_c0_g1~~TRINITY_DN1549_c0_g1_i5.p1  ORF type:complete len:216 (-),score=15.65 TRINITY_DN1549_c0_g1_i5:90-737(-)